MKTTLLLSKRGVLARPLILLSALLLLLAASGCGSGGGEEELSSIAQARQRWSRSQPRAYRYRFQLTAFLSPEAVAPVIVEVRNGVPISMVPANEGQSIDRITLARYDTIDDIFAVLEDAEKQKAENVKITFNSVYGYPEQANIDYRLTLADDEIGLTVSRFEVIP